MPTEGSFAPTRYVAISLIALIITIIVIIILAAISISAVTNSIESANFAKFSSDISTLQEAVTNSYGTEYQKRIIQNGIANKAEIYAYLAGGEEVEAPVNLSEQGATKAYAITNSNNLNGITGLPRYGTSNFYITDTGTVYMSPGYTYKEKIYVTAEIEDYNSETASGASVTLANSAGKNLIDYKIYGQSEQVPDPTPGDPKAVYGLGEKTRNLTNITERIMNSTGNYTITPALETSISNITVSLNTELTTKSIRCKFSYSNDGTNFALSSEYVYLYISDGVASNSFSVETSYKYFKFTIIPVSTTIFPQTLTNIQVEQGSNATPYIPYKDAIEVVSSGKNLFNENIFYDYDNGNSTDKEWVFHNNIIYNKNLITNYTFKENTSYTIRYTAKQTSGNPRLSIIYTDGSNVAVGDIVVISKNEYTTYTTSSSPRKTIKKICVSYGDVGLLYILKNSVQVEQGPIATAYEPYIAPITTTIDLTGHEPLRKIGDVADYIDYANGKIIRNIGKVKFNGIEIRVGGKNYDNGNYKSFFINNRMYNIKADTLNCLCSHFQIHKWQPPAGNYWWISTNSSGMRIDSLYLTNYTDDLTDNQKIDLANDWLILQYANGTPVTVYYQLAEPDTTERIMLPKISTTSGTCTITAGDGNLSASNIEVEYYSED